jgi:hypothetical protein
MHREPIYKVLNHAPSRWRRCGGKRTQWLHQIVADKVVWPVNWWPTLTRPHHPRLTLRAGLQQRPSARRPKHNDRHSSRQRAPLCQKSLLHRRCCASGKLHRHPRSTLTKAIDLRTNTSKEEYISVRDHRNRNPHFVAQSRHDPLMTAELNEKARIDEKTTAWPTYPISRSDLLPGTIEGYLDENSTEKLVRLYTVYAPKEDTVPSTGQRDVADAANKLRGMRIGNGARPGVETSSFAPSKMGTRGEAKVIVCVCMYIFT